MDHIPKLSIGDGKCADGSNTASFRFADVLRFRSAIAFLDFKGHPIALLQCFEPGHIDGRIVHKQIFTTFLLDKTIPLLGGTTTE